MLLAQSHLSDERFQALRGRRRQLHAFQFCGPVDLLPGVTMDKDSWGPAVQVGVDISLTKGVYLNLDLKKVMIRTDVKLAGAKVGEFKADPLLFGVGLGWRF